MMNPTLILATDLDGTFLGGSPAQRRELFDWLNDHPDQLLIFVTGRDLEFIRELIAQPGVPRPRYIIGDIGTSVYDGQTFLPIPEVEQHIAGLWGQGTESISALLDREPYLQLQPAEFRYRRSYDCDPAAVPAQVLRKIESAGFDWLLSGGQYLDVLPRGISKGPTLLRLLDHLRLPRDPVLVAGDTLNDLSLFQTRLKGVAVGNAEPQLRQETRHMASVYESPQPGAAGIWDALLHYQFRNRKEICS
ncbi:MAG TPA: HAD family hydrolase [Bryobacteraceae bacterium]|nr:HAD family hydrolase [Bryobacteraceae bacterium]